MPVQLLGEDERLRGVKSGGKGHCELFGFAEPSVQFLFLDGVKTLPFLLICISAHQIPYENPFFLIKDAFQLLSHPRVCFR